MVRRSALRRCTACLSATSLRRGALRRCTACLSTTHRAPESSFFLRGVHREVFFSDGCVLRCDGCVLRCDGVFFLWWMFFFVADVFFCVWRFFCRMLSLCRALSLPKRSTWNVSAKISLLPVLLCNVFGFCYVVFFRKFKKCS